MSLSKNQIKYIKSLQQKKFRQMYGNFVVEGDKMAKEILTTNSLALEGVFALEDWLEKNTFLLDDLNCPIELISNKDLDRISGLKTPNQVLIVVKQTKQNTNWDIVKTDLSLYLDNIQNPGNLGTIIRIADWFGIPNIFCSNNCVEWTNPKVIQASMGAFLRINIEEMEFESLKNQLENTPFFGAVMDGEDVFKIEKPKNGIIIIGNEGKGISKDILTQINHKISIPPHSENGSESLNASVAAGIICAAFRNT